VLNNNFTSQILGRESVEKLLQSVQLLDCSLPRPLSRRYTRMVSSSQLHFILNIGTETRTLAASFNRCQSYKRSSIIFSIIFFTKIQLAVTAIDISASILILTSVSCAQFRLKNSFYNSSLVPFFNLIFL
jgi:hypothetical protein